MDRKISTAQTVEYRFLPDYYLAGFTEKNSLDDRLWVLDRRLRNQVETSPRASARELGINPPGHSAADADRTAPVINRIAETKTLPAGSDFALLMDFITAVLLNLPAPRKMVNRFADDLAERVLCLVGDSREHYQGFLSKLEEESGIRVPTFEEAAEVLQSDEHPTPEDQRSSIRSRLNPDRLVLTQVENRAWNIIINDSPDHLFITSDQPTALVSLNKSGYYGPNLRSPDTVIYLPLNCRVMLVGGPGGHPEVSRVKGVREVARLNSLIVSGRARFIISPRENFVYMNPLKRLSFKDELIIKKTR